MPMNKQQQLQCLNEYGNDNDDANDYNYFYPIDNTTNDYHFDDYHSEQEELAQEVPQLMHEGVSQPQPMNNHNDQQEV